MPDPNLEHAAADMAVAQATMDALEATNEALEEENAALRQALEDCQNGIDVPALTAVRVFPQYRDKVYGNHVEVLALLGDLGVQRVSGLITPGSGADILDFYRTAYERYGIKVWFAAGNPHEHLNESEWDSLVGKVESLGEAVELISGWNEPNHDRNSGHRPPGWEVPTGEHQRALGERFIGKMMVGTPPLWEGDHEVAWADLELLAPECAGGYDTINLHWYPRGGDPEYLVDEQIEHHRAAYGNLPLYNTEGGYFTAPNYSGGSNPVTEEEQAYWLPKMIDSWTSRGCGIGLFELLDDPDPGGGNREAWFGLVRCPSLDPDDWSRKPSFDTVKARLAQ